MTLSIIRNGETIAEAINGEELYLVFRDSYQEGDIICFSPGERGFYTIQLDEAMQKVTLYSTGEEYRLAIPFGERKRPYPPVAFSSERHYLSARKALPYEYPYRNLAYNPYDWDANHSLFPHASANIETRGESVFAARNIIDGFIAANSHGSWPFESWGINRNPDAELSIDFGRIVAIDRLRFYNRADFPHDSWWTEGLVSFSDGSELTCSFEKKDGAQEFLFSEKKVSSLKLSHLIKTQDDPSPFPSLIQLEVLGREAF